MKLLKNMVRKFPYNAVGKAQATEFAKKYENDIVLTFYPMSAFYCYKHSCYHVGHNKYAKMG